MKHNSTNERIKREYFQFLKEAKRQNEATIDAVVKALNRFEEYTNYKDFKKFHIEQAVAFKAKLVLQVNLKTGQKLSNSTITSTLGHLKRFIEWLSQKPGYKSRISYADAEYFSPSEKVTRVARASRPKDAPTLEQITHVLQSIPTDSDIALRNRALIAFTILTGARDNAIASLSLKHVDLEKRFVYQDAREVRTKFSKSFPTYFFPVGDDIRQIVEDWVQHLRADLLWGDSDPLFPATEVKVGENNLFGAGGLKRQHWSNASPIRKIFKEAFLAADLPYFNPHSFRNTLVGLGQKICRTPEDFKAWSQNLGHEQVLTTFTSYGQVTEQRQSEIIRDLSPASLGRETEIDKIAEAIARKVNEMTTISNGG